jgi:hypothetical protein
VKTLLLQKKNLLTIAQTIIPNKPKNNCFDPVAHARYHYSGFFTAVVSENTEITQIYLENGFNPYVADNHLFKQKETFFFSDKNQWFGPIVLTYYEKPQTIRKYLLWKDYISHENPEFCDMIQSIICNIWQLCNDHIRKIEDQAKTAQSQTDESVLQ